MNKLYIKILSFFIALLDRSNKQKITFFLKKKLKNKKINIIDVGAHKGETIELFFDKFDVLKILAFEANPNIFNLLKKKIKKINFENKISLFNYGLGAKKEKKILQIFNDTSSSTFNPININSNYFKRKFFFLSFFKKNILLKKDLIEIFPLSDFQEFNEMATVDILKIDTEGYEFNVLKGIKQKDLQKINYIYFEHHYDLMIKKNYTYCDIKNFLNKNNFYLSLKIKMNFRKTFEYIYENKKY
jgi:FkbM family methyltransferase